MLFGMQQLLTCPVSKTSQKFELEAGDNGFKGLVPNIDVMLGVLSPAERFPGRGLSLIHHALEKTLVGNKKFG